VLQRRPAGRVFWLALPLVLTSGTFAASCHGVDLGGAASLGLEGVGVGGGGRVGGGGGGAIWVGRYTVRCVCGCGGRGWVGGGARRQRELIVQGRGVGVEFLRAFTSRGVRVVVRVRAWVGGRACAGAGAGWGVTRLGRERRRDASPACCVQKDCGRGSLSRGRFGGRWRGCWCSCVEDVRPRRLATGAVVGGGIYGVGGVGSGAMVGCSSRANDSEIQTFYIGTYPELV
jgi:hypothetical protein